MRYHNSNYACLHCEVVGRFVAFATSGLNSDSQVDGIAVRIFGMLRKFCAAIFSPHGFASFHRIVMSSFPEFDNAKLMIAASANHCRNTLEDLPVGQIVVDVDGVIRSIDVSTQKLLGLEVLHGVRVYEVIIDTAKAFPQKFSAAAFGDLGSVHFVSIHKTELPARVVCVPGAHTGTFLLSVVFS